MIAKLEAWRITQMDYFWNNFGKWDASAGSIHPSDPWPLPGHPEAMKKSYRRDYFHTSA